MYSDCSLGAVMARGVFGACATFRVGWRAAGGLGFCFSGVFF